MLNVYYYRMSVNRNACCNEVTDCIASFNNLLFLEHKCHKKRSLFVSSKYLNSALICISFNDDQSYKICNICHLRLLKHSKEKVEVKSEIDNFKNKSIEHTLLSHLDKKLESNSGYLKKSYRNCQYENRYKREVDLAFNILIMIIDQKRFKKDRLEYIQDKEHKINIPHCPGLFDYD